MTASERAAAEAFRLDLLSEFAQHGETLNSVRGLDPEFEVRESLRRTYREIKEVEHVLATGALPAAGSSPLPL